jgi:TPR repeat protein
MRLLSAALVLLMFAAGAARAQDVAPSLDEYNNVRSGLLMPENGSPAPGEQENAPPENEAAEDPSGLMTIDDLALAYQQGKFDIAARRLIPLAKNGQDQAQELVGIMYRNGQGVPKDPEQALLWLNKAAEANRPLAQHHLGIIYYTGDGVQADPVKALMWLQIAIVHYPEGPEKKRAIEDRDNASVQLTRRDRSRALQLAREWLDKKNEGHLLDAQQ